MQTHAPDRLMPEDEVRQKYEKLSRALRERGDYWTNAITLLRAEIDPWQGTEKEAEFQVATELLESIEGEVSWLNGLSLWIAPCAGNA